MSGDTPEAPKDSKWSKAGRAAMQTVGGSIPFAGGIVSAAASYWSEREAEEMAKFLRSWLEMLQEEMREKQRTIYRRP